MLQHSKQIIGITMIAHASEEQVTYASAMTSCNNRTAAEAVLPCGPAPGGQCCCNGTCDTTPLTSTGDGVSVRSAPRTYHSTDRVEMS
jgi:hypothetical protein